MKKGRELNMWFSEILSKEDRLGVRGFTIILVVGTRASQTGESILITITGKLKDFPHIQDADLSYL